MNPKYLLSFICLLFFATIGFAQRNDNNRIIPKDPNAASLIKHTEIPVSYFNGTAQTSVPLYQLTVGDINLPLTANYHSSGIKTTEEASWIGLGWSLQCGGLVSEEIVGKNDISFQGISVFPYPCNANTLPESGPEATNRVGRGEDYKDQNGNPVHYTKSEATSLIESNHEYDMLICNFNGYSTKFIKPSSTSDYVSVDQQNIKLKTNSTAGILTYEAITPDGAHYYFEDVAITETPQFVCNQGTVDNIIARTYYLSRIKSASGRIIYFTYKRVTAPSLVSLSEVWSLDEYATLPQETNIVINTYEPLHQGSTSQSIITTLYLDEINFDTGKIKFVTTARDDIQSGLKLDAIEVYNKTSLQPVQKFTFNYDYFVGSNSYGDWTTDSQVRFCGNNPATSLNYKQKRLKLNSITINNGNSAQNSPSYLFEYNTTPLPYKTSLAQDIWGYFNGATTNHTLLPNYTQLGYIDTKVPYQIQIASNKPTLAYRSAKVEFAQAGVLNKITYPTKGYSTFEYELNTFEKPLFLGEASNADKILVPQNEGAVDIGTGTQVKEFTIPDINYIVNGGSYNPCEVSVQLFCCGSAAGCNGSQGYLDCTTVQSCQDYLIGMQNMGLYCLLEKYNSSSNTWTIISIWDLVNNRDFATGRCDMFSASHLYQPGRYRLTANYPDAKAPGVYGTRMAAINIQYQTLQVPSAPNAGAGLRIKKIVDYTSANQIATQRMFTYTSGKLMTKPVFYRNYSDYELLTQIPNTQIPNLGLVSCNFSVGSNPWYRQSYGPCPSSGTYTVPLAHKHASLYSTPLVPYSYSANGSLVGYTSVTIDYDQSGQKGRTQYTYNNDADMYAYYGINVAGIPSSRILTTGTLKTMIELKYMGPNSFIPVKMTELTYQIANHKNYWAYKSDYHSLKYASVNTNGTPSNPTPYPEPTQCLNSFYLFLHFYPVKVAHINTVTKTERYLQPGSPTLATTTQYSYNSINQLREERWTGSDQAINTKTTYYPADYTATAGILKIMKDNNLLDYPVETIDQKNSKTTAAVYTQYYQHDNIVSAQQSFSLKTKSSITDFKPSIVDNTKDTRYGLDYSFTYSKENNVLTTKKEDDISIVYLWGYNSTYPIAEIKNATQTEVLSAMGLTQAQLESNAAAATPSADYLTRINNLRTAQAGAISSSLPQAMITTYEYIPLVGMSSSTNASGVTTYYEYDLLQRLKAIRDKNPLTNGAGNVLKSYDYHYKPQ